MDENEDVPRSGINPEPPDTAPPQLGRWHPLVRILVYVGSSQIVLNIAGVVLFLLFLLATGRGEALADGAAKLLGGEGDPDIPTSVVLGITAAGGPALWLWTWFQRNKLDQRTMRSLGFRAAGALPLFVRGWLGGALAPGLILGAGLLMGAYKLGPVDGVSPDFLRIGILPFALYLIAFVIQGSTEELILRGYIQRNIMEWKAGQRSLVWILVVPSILFGLGHLANPGFGLIPFANTVLIGIFFGALVLARGELWSVCGVHAGWNFALGVVWSLPVSGLKMDKLLPVEVNESSSIANLLFGGIYGPEGGVVTTILILIAVIVTLPRALATFERDAWGTGSR